MGLGEYDGVASFADFVIIRVADDFVCLSGALFDGVGGLGHWLVEDAWKMEVRVLECKLRALENW